MRDYPLAIETDRDVALAFESRFRAWLIGFGHYAIIRAFAR